jgi:hypothetical protein
VEAAQRALRALLPESKIAFDALRESATDFGRETLDGFLQLN